MKTVHEQISHLLEPGERAEPLNLGGWIVLSKQLQEGDHIIIHDCCWFNHQPVRAVVRMVNFINNVAITLLTAGATDANGREWQTGLIPGFMDIKWHTYKVLQ
jgi:hypothetical protein